MSQPDRGGRAEIVVQLATGASSSIASALQQVVADLGGEWRAMHPSTTDPDLARLAVVIVSAAEAQEVAARIRTSPGVEAAYVKPPADAPLIGEETHHACP